MHDNFDELLESLINEPSLPHDQNNISTFSFRGNFEETEFETFRQLENLRPNHYISNYHNQ